MRTGSLPGAAGAVVARRVGLVVFGVAVGFALFLVMLAAGERAGLLRDLSPPPHFKPVVDAQGRAVRDARGRELFAIDPELAAARAGRSDSDRFAVAREKDAGTFRILSIGESTTFGAGYDGRASYSRFLEARLRTRLGRDSVEVVNCGKNGYDSRDWLTLAGELEGFAPDLLVVYAGHNELKKPNLIGVVEPAKARLRRSRLLRRLLGEPRDDVPAPPSIQVGSFLDPDQRAFALSLFDGGLRALLDAARECRVPVVLCIPASNVLDQPPRLSVVRPGADAAARLATVREAGRSFDFGELIEPAADADRDAAERALLAVEQALARDDAAILHFRRGRILLALGRTEPARAALSRSLELDGLPERAPPDFVGRTRALAREYGVLVADVESRFEREARRGVAGYDLCFDYGHPNLFGHFVIADEILAAIERAGASLPIGPLDPAREQGATLRERFDACCRALDLSESGAARALQSQGAAQLNAIGTRSDPDPGSWAVPEEFLAAALRLDPGRTEDVEFLVLRACTSAGRGDGAAARRDLAAAKRLDAGRVGELARAVAALPGLVAALLAVGVEAQPDGFRWKEPP